MVMLLGKKVGMTQVFDETGKLVPVTVIQAGPCAIMQVKTSEDNGYNAVQLGFDDIKASRVKKPQAGHAEKSGTSSKRFIREMRLPNSADVPYKAGEFLTVSVFEKEKLVDVIGISKGKGYAGVMKRHNFGGFPASHGTERRHRAPGSIASFATDRGHSGKLKKGKRMSGHMGDARVTTKNHVLVSIDPEKNLLVIKGPVPGPAGSYCIVRSAIKKLKQES